MLCSEKAFNLQQFLGIPWTLHEAAVLEGVTWSQYYYLISSHLISPVLFTYVWGVIYHTRTLPPATALAYTAPFSPAAPETSI